MDDFHLMLPSTVRNLAGNANKGGLYTTYLAKTINLDKTKWKVAVVDLSYTKTWFDFPTDVCLVVRHVFGYVITTEIPMSAFRDLQSLIKGLNDVLSKEAVIYNAVTGFVEIHVGPAEHIILHKITAAMLGHGLSEFANKNTSDSIVFKGTTRPNVHRPIRHIYMYSNIIEHVPVGDVYAPLLQIVPVPQGERGVTQHVQFRIPMYMSLAANDLSVIDIKLCNTEGDVIDFPDFTEVVVKLHFKRVVD